MRAAGLWRLFVWHAGIGKAPLKSPRSNLRGSGDAFLPWCFVMRVCTSSWKGGAAAVHMAAVCYLRFLLSNGLERLVVGGIGVAGTSLA